MNKLTKIAAVALIAISPLLASAHHGSSVSLGSKLGVNINDNEEVKADGMLKSFHKLDKENDGDKKENESDATEANEVHLMGTVTAVGATSFNFTAKDGSTFTVNTGGAALKDAFGGSILLSGIAVNSNASIEGTASGSVITADKVVVTPANTHKAKGKGTITAVSGNTITVQQNNHGIVSSFTANTNASTTVIASNGATTTISSLLVGTKVVIKGLWDEILNVLKAITIHIK